MIKVAGARALTHWALGLVLVGAGWLASPDAVPIYDGVGAPDEPYRYVDTADLVTAATQQVRSSATIVGAVRLETPEQGPQLLLDLPAGQLTGTALPEAVAVTALAFRPVGAPPRGAFDGNGYRLLTAPVTAVTSRAEGFVFLRAAVMTQPDPVIVHRPAADVLWQEVPTRRAGRDILAAQVTSLGDYAVVRLPGSTPVPPPGSNRVPLIFALAVTLMLITITITYLRNHEPDDDE